MKPQPIQIGDCLLQPGTHCLEREGRLIQLEPKDFQILMQLIESAPTVVTTAAMMRYAWHTSIVSDNSVHQVIRRLRVALGDDARNPTYIKTVPKVGYRIVAPVHITTEANVQSSEAFGVIAVLPFRDYAEAHPHAYVVDGLLFELQTALAARGVQLVSWDTMLEVRSRGLTDQELHTYFGADCVLDGSLITRGSRMRVNAALNHIPSARQVWSGTYDLNGDNLFNAHSALARQITADLFDKIPTNGTPVGVHSLKKPLDPFITSRTARHTSAAAAVASC